MSKNVLWKEYTTDDGRKYYFNTKTKVSVWDKPAELKTAQESSAEKLCPWNEYTAPNGSKYYHNRDTGESVWEMPDEYRRIMLPAQNAAASKRGEDENDGEELERMETLTMDDQPQRADAEEGEVVETGPDDEKAFISLLWDMVPSSQTSWEKALSKISADKRFVAVKKIGKRRAIFNDWLREKATQERMEERVKSRERKQDYLEMVKEKYERGLFDLETSYRDAVKFFELDSRFKMVAHESERSEYYMEFIDRIIEKKKEDERRVQQEALQRFTDALKDDQRIDLLTDWTFIEREYLQKEEYKGLKPVDALEEFDRYMRHRDDHEKRSRNQRRDALFRVCRKKREAFLDLLLDLRKKGMLPEEAVRSRERKTNPDARVPTNPHELGWKEVEAIVRESPEYKAFFVPEYSGSLPVDLYATFLEREKDMYFEHRKEIGQCLYRIGFKFQPNTTFDEMWEVLKEADKNGEFPYGLKRIDEENAMFYYNERVKRATDGLSGRLEGNKKWFWVLLNKKSFYFSPDSVFDCPQYRTHIYGTEPWANLGNDTVRKQVFDHFITQLRLGNVDKDGNVPYSDPTPQGSRPPTEPRRSAEDTVMARERKRVREEEPKEERRKSRARSASSSGSSSDSSMSGSESGSSSGSSSSSSSDSEPRKKRSKRDSKRKHRSHSHSHHKKKHSRHSSSGRHSHKSHRSSKKHR